MGSRQVPSEIRTFKGETVFDWESEPGQERPTDFSSSTQFASTGYSHSSGYSRLSGYSTLESQRGSSRRPRRRAKQRGSVWVPATLVFAFAVSGLIALAHYLHH